jgi:hypothetical protein
MVADCAAWSADVVVVDSTGELLPMFGANSDNADDFTKVHNRVLQPLAKTGAAVLLVDHLAKGRNSRQLGQGGSIAKRRTVGGLSLRVVRERPFTRNGGGSALLWVNKDRHGGVRQYCAVVRPASKDRDEQLAGTFVLDATEHDAARWRVTPAQENVSHSGQTCKFRPTNLMERASRSIEEHPGKYTRNQVAADIGGRRETALLVVDLLEEEGFITRAPGQAGHKRCSSVTPYRESEDPASDSYQPKGDRLRQHQAGGLNRPGFRAHFLSWERRRALRVLRGVGNRVLMSPSSGVREGTIGGCVSRSTPIFLWCREPVWERGGGGRTVSRPFAGTVDCCFEHV